MMEATCPPCRLDESDPTEKAFEKGPLDHLNLQRSNYNNTNGGKPAKKQKPWDSIYQIYMLKKTKRSSVAKMGKSIELERRHYYRKAVGLMTTGVAIFGLGIAFGVLYFLDVQQRRNLLMAGPICLAVGLLVFICGLVWIPIIKTKLKKKIQQQKTQNRYGI